MSRRMSRTLSKNVTSGVTAWDVAISDAEQQIQESSQRIIRLRESIKVFKKLRDSGEPFPGGAETSEAALSSFEAKEGSEAKPLLWILCYQCIPRSHWHIFAISLQNHLYCFFRAESGYQVFIGGVWRGVWGGGW